MLGFQAVWFAKQYKIFNTRSKMMKRGGGGGEEGMYYNYK